MSEQVLHGVVFGDTIRLESPIDLSDGEAVDVIVRPRASKRQWGDGIRASAGVLSHLPKEVDDDLQEILRERHEEQHREVAE